MSSQSIQPILVLLSGSSEANPTQYMIEKVIAHHDIDARYLTAEVAPERLADALTGIKAMGFFGGHFSDGHKQAAVSLLEKTSDVAAVAGVANCFSREGDVLRGDNLEGQGVLAVLRRAIDAAGKRVVLLGAGRVARAIGFELAVAGVAEVRVVNRTEAHAHSLAEMLVGRFSTTLVSAAGWEAGYAVPPEADILIHATSAAREDPAAALPLALDSLRKELVVVDVTFDPPKTWLVGEAARRGCTTLDGLDIFIEQRAIALRNWTGVDVDRGVMREAAEEYLEV